MAALLALTGGGLAEGATNNTVLILYDPPLPPANDPAGFTWFGNLHAKFLANLMGHFDLSCQIKSVNDYQAGEMDGVRATFYFGVIYRGFSGNPDYFALPTAFLDDAVTTTNPVCWFQNNLWQVSGTEFDFIPKPFDAKYGFRWVGGDGSGLTNVHYKGEVFFRHPLAVPLIIVSNFNTNIAATAVFASRTNADTSVTQAPYVTRASNFWYVADSPFDYMGEDSHYVAFSDLLHDILGIDHAESHHAVIRLEDVTMKVYSPGKLTMATDYFRSNSVPFGIALISLYTDPLGYYTVGNVPEQHRISDTNDAVSAAMLGELRHAATNGGQFIMHGYTHQYDSIGNPTTGTSADDFEFWRETLDTNGNIFLYEPIAEDSVSWVSNRVASARGEFAAAGLTPVAFEPPHYAASALDYYYFATNFSLTMQRVLYFSDDYNPTAYSFPSQPPHIGGQFFPYFIEQDVYGQTILPENLGNFEPDPLVGAVARSAADVVRSAKKNLVVRDGWANCFFHGFYDHTNMHAIVEGVKALGYVYIPVSPSGPPVITFQPRSQTNIVGETVKFGVAVIGSKPLGYQWRLNNTNISGANEALLELADVQLGDAGNYTAVITNAFGSITSSVATLTLIAAPVITGQPQNQTNLVNTTATFTVTAVGTAPLSYQWLFNSATPVGGDNATLTLSNVQTNQAGDYSVVVSNAYGAVTSAVVTLTVNEPPAITNQPVSQAVLAGSDATFTVGATGMGTLSYQWRFNGTNISGETATSLTVSNVQPVNAGDYTVVVTNSFGAVTSAIATLTVNVSVFITSQPTNQSVILSNTASFSVGAGGTAPLHYQWFFNTNNPIADATNSSLTISNAQAADTGAYSVVVTNNFGAVTSAVATLTVNIPPSITNQPASRSVVQGSNATFTVGATGDATLVYQWLFNGTNLGGATANSLTVTNVQPTNAGNYTVVVTNNSGAVTSAVAALTVNQPPGITNQPASQSVLVGSNVTFVVGATGTAPLAYQWLFNGTNIGGEIGTSLLVTNVQTNNAGDYTVVITNAYGAVTSSVATLTVSNVVNLPPSITTQPQSQTNTVGATVSFTVTVSGTSPFTYRWRFNGTNLAAANTNSLTLANVQATNAGNYTVVASNAFGAATSSVASLTVIAPFAPQTSLAGKVYQWQQAGVLGQIQINANGTYVWTPNVGAAQTGFYSYEVQAGKGILATYRFVGVGSGYDMTWNQMTFTNTNAGTYVQWTFSAAQNMWTLWTNNFFAPPVTNTPPAITAQPQGQTISAGNTANFSVTASGTGTLVYQWRVNGANLTGATSNTLSLVNVQTNDAGNYTVVVTNAFGAVTSSVAVLTVITLPIINTQPQSQTVSVGNTANFSVSAIGAGTLGYQWRFNGTNLVGATSNTLAVANAQTNHAGSYTVVITNAFGAVTSAVAMLTVNPPATGTSPASLAGRLYYMHDLDNNSWSAVSFTAGGVWNRWSNGGNTFTSGYFSYSKNGTGTATLVTALSATQYDYYVLTYSGTGAGTYEAWFVVNGVVTRYRMGEFISP